MMLELKALRDFAKRYTAAWCSQNPAAVAAHFASQGSLTINNGVPSIGRAAITAAAQSFMTAFPDIQVQMDDLVIEGDAVIYHWTLTGTNTGPSGTGHRVRISGFEKWKMNEAGLISESTGKFDEHDYEFQLKHGSAETQK
jgi:uncharacterized protein (TIGR02246 family)